MGSQATVDALRRRIRDVDPLDAWTMPSLPTGDDPISAILTVLGLIVLIPVVIALAAALIEVLLLLLLIPILLLVRIALRKPWIVEVIGPDRHYYTESVPRFAASGAHVQQIAASIRTGAAHPRSEASP